MKIKYLWITLLALTFFGCDDNTASLGWDVMPGGDNIPVKSQNYKVITQSILSDSIFARSSTAYLGKYTDPDFGVFEADFLTQFNCTDNFQIDHKRFDSLKVEGTLGIDLILYYSAVNGYYGDSLSANRLSVYELNNVLNEASKEIFYTSIDPSKYYDKSSLLAKRAYTIKDLSFSDSLWNVQNVHYIKIPLPLPLAERILKENKENPESFKNSATFIEKVFKGIYVNCDYSEGSILYIDNIILNLHSDIHGTNSQGAIIRDSITNEINRDSIVHNASIAQFTATKEVIQANRFQNSEKLEELAADKRYTYLKTPAGIFTEAALPIEEIISGEHRNDTINSVQLSFTAYNKVGGNNTPYKMPLSQNILMVRKKDMYSFFEKNQLYDNATSYISTLSPKNLYKFSNINSLITTCINEKKTGEKSDPNWLEKNKDWNKIVLIPVEIVRTGSDQTIAAVRHNLKLTSAKLEGGSEGKQIDMSVTYTSFK